MGRCQLRAAPPLDKPTRPATLGLPATLPRKGVELGTIGTAPSLLGSIATETAQKGAFWEGMLFWKLLEYLPFYLFALHGIISSLKRKEN